MNRKVTTMSSRKPMKNRPHTNAPNKAEKHSDNELITELKSKVAELESSFLKAQDENHLLTNRLRQTHLLYKIAAVLNSTYDTTKLYNIIQTMLGDISFVRHHAMIEKSSDSQIKALFYSNPGRDKSMSHILDVECAVSESVFATQKEVYIDKLSEHQGFVSFFPERNDGSVIAIPLTSNKRSTKVLCFHAPDHMLPNEIEFLRLITNEIGVAIERTQIYQETFEISIKDALTGIFNRRYFNDRVLKEFNRAKRYKRQVSFILMDIDNFKKFNDTFGHKVGDEVLIWVAHRLNKGCRDCDILARYGGEEFIMILPETDMAGAVIAAEKLRKAIDEESHKINHLFVSTNEMSTFHAKNITISLGVSTFPKDGATVEALLEKADQHLYVAKARGRNQVSSDDGTL